ncbi:MAG TPA: PfkB family carbohydrate kinase, partial [Verrucomicrobiaceae bacterium]
AACRQGGIVSLVGCVGADDYGLGYLDYLASQGLNVAGVIQRSDAATGSAYVLVNPKGENSIVALGGANGLLTAEDVLSQGAALDSADMVLCQLETTIEATIAALQYASARGKITLLNPSPLHIDFPWGEQALDFLIVNEREAAALLGYFVENTAAAPRIRGTMANLGVSTLIITRGGQPTLAFSAHQALKVPPPAVEVVNTVGAGDAFAGAFAVHWAQTQDLLSALRKANIAGAIATTRPGAQDAIPTREEVDAFVARPLTTVTEEATETEAAWS